MARMTISEDYKKFSLNCNKLDCKIAELKLQALEICIKHDIRPAVGQFANAISVSARQHAAMEILKWAIDPPND